MSAEITTSCELSVSHHIAQIGHGRIKLLVMSALAHEILASAAEAALCLKVITVCLVVHFYLFALFRLKIEKFFVF